MQTDMTLTPEHGFYRLAPNNARALDYLKTAWRDGWSDTSQSVLLPQFFGDAATLASQAVRDGFSLLWGLAVYPAGPAGADALYDEVG